MICVRLPTRCDPLAPLVETPNSIPSLKVYLYRADDLEGGVMWEWLWKWIVTPEDDGTEVFEDVETNDLRGPVAQDGET